MKKLRIAVLFGGRSGEHDVSLMSARSVLAVLDPEKYEVTQIGITLDGEWLNGVDTLEAFSQGNFEKMNRVGLPSEPSHSALYILKYPLPVQTNVCASFHGRSGFRQSSSTQ